MSLLLDPKLSIVPICGMKNPPHNDAFLGTGSFIGEERYLLTAKHVIDGWEDDIFISTYGPHPPPIYPAKIITTDKQTDLALLIVDGYTPKFSFKLAEDNEIHLNTHVVCYEYSHTRYELDKWRISPACRLGNVTRIIENNNFISNVDHSALELSFPALTGSSGAPVLSNKDIHLWGIIKANVEYHLLPVKTESYLDNNTKSKEETKYMLPQAIAIHVKHIRSLIESI